MSRILLLGLILVLGACAPRPPVAPLPLSPALESTLLERLSTYGEAFNSLKGLAKVRLSTGEKPLSGSQVLVAEKPDRFRAETLSPFGQILLLVAANGELLTALVPSEGEFYQGPASMQNVQRFTRVPLQLSDLVGILLYQVPLIDYQQTDLAAGKEGYLLTLRGVGGRRQELLFDSSLRLIRSAYSMDDKTVLRIFYDRFTEGESSFPRTIFLEMPEQQAQASISFSEVEMNPPVSRDLFKLTPPPGYVIRPFP